MARPASQHPTDFELEILKVLWRDGPKPVRHVRDALAAAGRELAYTSVMTVMNIMADKGYVRRNKNPRDGGGYVYHPLVKEQATTGRMLRSARLLSALSPSMSTNWNNSPSWRKMRLASARQACLRFWAYSSPST